jgi:hypothetical protein
MKGTLLAGVTVVVVLVSGHAVAETVRLNAEQRSKIRDVLKNATEVTITAPARIGAKLANNVPLAPVPKNWGASIAKYVYVLTPVPTASASGTTYDIEADNNQIVLVRSSTREIVDIIR